MGATALVWDLIAKDQASPAFLRVAGAADKAAVATSRATKGMNAHVVSAGKLGAKLAKNLTVPLLALSGVAVSQAVKFQKSMTLIQTAGGETAAKAAEISVGIKKIATATGSNLNALSDGIYAVAKAGAVKWSAVEQLGVLKAAAQGAKAENVDLGTSVNALTSVMTSYGYSADKAVSVENMLIRGSGLAKTTMQDFAGSLSTVVPLAGALHISFSQVAGAIATMTQHGESAQQATENLNNLITNLAGQNNVASSAMQQLGINTVDLSKNLGKRGLTGTLAIVEAALKAHTKNGLVVTDVHKAAALATKSLNTEMGTFSGDLKAQSAALLTGGTSIAAYMKYAKSLGGVQGASALQFLSLYKSSKGFSDQLKAGNGTARTTTATMQKLLGGMTGMGAVLKLNGRDAHLFGQNVAEVAKASRESGTDVLGWAKTQDTLAVKMDKAKASLQVLAVEVGTALIPAITKIVSGVSSAVHWFENLSGTQKKILGWSLGIVAAIGPVLAIGAKLALLGRGLSLFAVGAGNSFARIAGSASGMSAGVTRGMQGVSAAVGGASIGLAFGTLTRNASLGVKAVSALGSAAAGAAMGFSAGGPLGAAIGGLAGGLSSVAAGFFGSGESAQKAAANVATFTAAIDADTGALGKNLRASVAKSLQDAGALDQARKLGLSLYDVTSAAMGQKTALSQVTGTLRMMSIAGYGSSDAQQATARAAKLLLNTLGGTNSEIAKAIQAHKNMKTAASASAKATDATGAAANRVQPYLGTLGLALDALAKKHTVSLDTGAASSALSGLTSQATSYLSVLQLIENGPSVKAPAAGGPSLIGATPTKAHASGGGVGDGFFTVGERGYELGHKRGNRVQIFSHSQSVAMTGRNQVPGYASGTDKVSGPATTLLQTIAR